MWFIVILVHSHIVLLHLVHLFLLVFILLIMFLLLLFGEIHLILLLEVYQYQTLCQVGYNQLLYALLWHQLVTQYPHTI